jgi:putative peptidoglycan lipid II flippase
VAKGAGGAALVALGILLSRVAGLVRERVFAHYLGNSEAAGAFKAALRIPNFLQNLFGEGVLSGSFIPVYARLLAKGDPEAARVAGVVGAVLSAAVTVLVGLGVVASPYMVDLVAPGFEGETRDLTVRLVQILFPGVGLLVVSAWCLGILNSHRRFFLSYAAPVLWNVAMIGGLLLAGKDRPQDEVVRMLAWASVVGSGLQLVVQVPTVWRLAGPLKFQFDLGSPHVREVFRNLGPVVLTRGVVQVSAYIDAMIASYLGATAVSGVAYAQTIYLLPVSLFGMSVAAAELPAMSGEVGAGAAVADALRTRIEAGGRRIAYFVIPSMAALLLVGRDAVAVLFQTGAFGEDDTRYVWFILVGAAGGLLAATWSRLYSSAFFALGDTRTPFRFALVRVTASAALGSLLAFPGRSLLVGAFDTVLGVPERADLVLGMGAVGLTAGSALAGWIELTLLRWAMSKRIGATGIPLGFTARLWAVALVAGGLGWAAPELVVGRAPALVVGAIAIGVFGVFYLGVTTAMGLGEARAVLRRFRR